MQKDNSKNNKELLFNFEYDKIAKHCNEIYDDEKVLYLEWVKKEYLQAKNSLFDFNDFGEPLNKKIDFEIKYLEKKNKIEREKYKGIPQYNSKKVFNRIFGKPSKKYNSNKNLNSKSKIVKEDTKAINEMSTSLKKFKFQGTEKSILIIIDLLYNSNFISSEDYNKANAILRDSFLNKEGKQFNNKQLSVTRKKMDKNKTDSIGIGEDDYTKFADLLKNLQKYIKD